jgi:membrane-associated protease RseP (regulator of RpoE activity)
MTSPHTLSRLHAQLAQLIALETAIDQQLALLIPVVAQHADVTALLTQVQTLSKDHRQALEVRLRSLTATSNPLAESTPLGDTPNRETNVLEYPLTTALQTVYTLCHQAVIGYAVLHPLATRFRDSPFVAPEGTAYHLARQYTQEYAVVIQDIARLLHDVVLWELDHEGQTCQCPCPACGVGICLCALAGRFFLRQTWETVGPIAADVGVYVQTPKPQSIAMLAGLRRGDVVVALDGKPIESFWELQNRFEDSDPGQVIQLTIRRDAEVLEDVAIVRSAP